MLYMHPSSLLKSIWNGPTELFSHGAVGLSFPHVAVLTHYMLHCPNMIKLNPSVYAAEHLPITQVGKAGEQRNTLKYSNIPSHYIDTLI